MTSQKTQQTAASLSDDYWQNLMNTLKVRPFPTTTLLVAIKTWLKFSRNRCRVCKQSQIRTTLYPRKVHIFIFQFLFFCHREPRRGQHSVAICFCHEHVESSETERLPSRPDASGIVYPLTSNSTSRRQHLSNAVLKLFCLIGASLNICKWLCAALPVF